MRPDGRGKADVREHQPPGKVCPPLELAEAHLDGEEAEQREPEPEQARRSLAPSGQIAQGEEEPDAEDDDRACVENTTGWSRQSRETARAAARMRSGGRGQRSGNEQRQRSRGDEQGQTP